MKSSIEMLSEHNARRLLNSVQNHEILSNDISIYMRIYLYKHFLYEKKILFQIDAENFNAKFE